MNDVLRDKNDVPFRDFVVQRQLDDLRHYVDARLTAEQRAIDNARQSMDKRLDGMNEFRETLNQQARSFVSREEFDTLRKHMDSAVGRSEFEAVRKLVYMALGMSVMIVVVVPLAAAYIARGGG